IRKPQAKLIKPLFIVGVLLSIFLSGGVGAFLGVNASRVFWHVGLLPAQFPFFSLASGAALLLLILSWVAPVEDESRAQQLRVLGLITIALVLIKLFFLWTDFSQSLYAGVPDNVNAINAILFGEYWWVFWIVQIGLGSILPIIILAIPKLGKNGCWAGAIALLVLIGIAISRVNIVVPGLVVPEFAGLSTAFQGPHLSNTYFPSLMEWLVVSGGIGIAILVFLIGAERLPLWLSKSTQTPEAEVKQ
ncbi:MAG: NrfD/PsrC family molybdoenzyme membrane anchor subunit, partial [Anaerolineaceae bacterium]